jgi:hypothetical protein
MNYFKMHWAFFGLMLLFFVSGILLKLLPLSVANSLALPVLAVLTVATSGVVAIYFMRVYRDYLAWRDRKKDE